MRLGFPSAGLGFPSGWFGFPSGWLGFPSAQLGIPSVRPGNGSLRHSGAEVALGSPLVPAGGGRLGSYFPGFIPLQALDLEHSSILRGRKCPSEISLLPIRRFAFAHPPLPFGHPWAGVRACRDRASRARRPIAASRPARAASARRPPRIGPRRRMR
jgi:hypothetical protein